MPIYDFECRSCNARFERLQKLSDPDPTVCPECGKETIKRRLTAPAFRLAGSGWYETDFKKDGDTKRNLAGKDEAPAAKTESKSEPADKPKAETPAAATPKPKPDGAAGT
ncbi:MAG TPA: FmdB family zinc ribbon protein [Dokdonella sp.]